MNGLSLFMALVKTFCLGKCQKVKFVFTFVIYIKAENSSGLGIYCQKMETLLEHCD